MTKKEIAIAFLQLAGTGKVQEAFSQFVAPDFVHHNQYFRGSREALQKAMAEAHLASPNKAIHIKHSYKDGDTVITHSLVIKEEMDIAVVHIFRLHHDKIIELWDLGQAIANECPNENGLF